MILSRMAAGSCLSGRSVRRRKKLKESAKRSGQYYVNHRWLGGMMTNWKTISVSIARLRELEDILGSEAAHSYTKKEVLMMTRERDKA